MAPMITADAGNHHEPSVCDFLLADVAQVLNAAVDELLGAP